jgi:hypothetical protein
MQRTEASVLDLQSPFQDNGTIGFIRYTNFQEWRQHSSCFFVIPAILTFRLQYLLVCFELGLAAKHSRKSGKSHLESTLMMQMEDVVCRLAVFTFLFGRTKASSSM